mmetsp:Transcript_49747/g.89335  ORF Transcript_49747/g.89335 Transcript_49747/m.89335 type:complete len:209 (+) Transcript_49747:698-1324(+)
MPSDEERQSFAFFSQAFFALSLTTLTTAFTSSSDSPKDFARERNSVVLSTAANSGCQACAKSTGTLLLASRLASKQKSKTTGFPASSAVGSWPGTVSVAPSLAARRIPTLAFVEQTSRACFLPSFSTKSRVSPKTLDWISATFSSFLQSASNPPLQPLPGCVRLIKDPAFSDASSASIKAFAAPPSTSSCAAVNLSPGTTGSVKSARA